MEKAHGRIYMKVKELIQRIEADEWVKSRQRGSHQQVKHAA